MLCSYGAGYLLLSRDSHFQLPPDPGKSPGAPTKTKRVVFVRHGESVWNACFNRPVSIALLFRVLAVLMKEACLLLCLDSCLFDSPLSAEGVAQAISLQQFLEGDQGEELRRLCGAAIFTTSCLRRAAATALIGCRWTLCDGRPVWALSCLQEISRNVDTLALAAPQRPPPLLAGADDGLGGDAAQPQCLQAPYSNGNKGILANGLERMDLFCEWVFSECSPAALQSTVVVFGHSIWFRTFFQTYLPHTAYHECKHTKIVNCGVVAFDLELLVGPRGSSVEYRVVPESVVSLYGGFEAAPKKKRWWHVLRGKKTD